MGGGMAEVNLDGRGLAPRSVRFVMRRAFVGPPGSGTGTQSKLLRERLGLPTIGTGDILRDTVRRGGELGQKVKPILESGQLVPDDLVNVIVADLFRRDDRP